MKRLLTIVGTRPNFIKVTQFKRVAHEYENIELRIAHTGQHYDDRMAKVFFDQFGMEPDHALGVKGKSTNDQMARTMIALEELIDKEYHPDMILVVGDVNATLAGALTANKFRIPFCHVESGLRSFDRGMPEEVNRVLTDEMADRFFVTEESGKRNLLQEGKVEERIHFVGNTMIDTLLAYEDSIDANTVLDDLGLERGAYALMTIHRPATVDHEEGLRKLLELVRFTTEDRKLVFPIHPRTKKNLKHFGLWEKFQNLGDLVLSDPMGYFAFQKLIKEAGFILTDSGGIQEESTFRQVPCLTLRKNTERPVTVDIGTNTLVPYDTDRIKELIVSIVNGTYKKGKVPPFWDGKATERIFEVLEATK